MSDEGCLPLVAIFDVNIVIPPSNIKLGEMASIFQLVHEVRDEREEVSVMNDVFIKVPVILAGVEFPVFLFDEEKGGGLRRIEGMKFPGSYVFFKEILSSFLFVRGKQVDFAYLRHKGIVEVDFMVIRLGWRDMLCGFFQEDLSKVSIF